MLRKIIQQLVINELGGLPILKMGGSASFEDQRSSFAIIGVLIRPLSIS